MPNHRSETRTQLPPHADSPPAPAEAGRRPPRAPGPLVRTLLVLAALPAAPVLGALGMRRPLAFLPAFALAVWAFLAARRAGAPLPVPVVGAGLLVLAAFTASFAASGALLQARGHRTSVPVTDVRRVHDRNGTSWTCTLGDLDGRPISDPTHSCRGPAELHRRVPVLTDPQGAVDPMTAADADSSTTAGAWALGLSALSAAFLGLGTSPRFRLRPLRPR